MTRRTRPCRNCVLRTLAGVAWPMWGGRPEGWPRLTRCRTCNSRLRG